MLESKRGSKRPADVAKDSRDPAAAVLFTDNWYTEVRDPYLTVMVRVLVPAGLQNS